MKYEYRLLYVSSPFDMDNLNDYYSKGWEFVHAINTEKAILYTIRLANCVE